MGEVRYVEAIEVGAPRERVYAHRLDFENLPRINPSVTSFRRTDGGAHLGVGASYAFDTTIEGMGTIPTTLVVTEAVAPERIANEMNAGLIARETTTFTPTASGGTRIELDVRIEVPDDLDDAGRRFIEDSGRAQVRAELEHIKRALESGDAVEVP